jgi:hypothetical protein
MVAISTNDLSEGKEAPINFVASRSGKVDKICGSSLAVEAYAMEACGACIEWIQQAYAEMSNALFHPTWIKFRTSEWDLSTPTNKPRLKIQGVLLFRDNADPELKKNLAISDAKSLYDSLKKEARGKEPKIAIAVGAIKQSFAATGTKERWAPHNVMLADGLTKKVAKANIQPLLKAMTTGKYKITSEVDEMTHRQELKDKGQTLQRQKRHTAMAAVCENNNDNRG